MAKKTATKKKYTATVKMGGRSIKGEGKSVEEALANIPAIMVRANSVLTVSNGDKSVERILNGSVLHRLLNSSPSIKSIMIKKISLMYDVA